MGSEYILEGKSEHGFNDRSPERMEVLNKQLNERVEAVRSRVAKKREIREKTEKKVGTVQKI